MPLSPPELAALVELAKSECRHPRDQARFLVRQELRQRGFLEMHSKRESEITLTQAVERDALNKTPKSVRSPNSPDFGVTLQAKEPEGRTIVP